VLRPFYRSVDTFVESVVDVGRRDARLYSQSTVVVRRSKPPVCASVDIDGIGHQSSSELAEENGVDKPPVFTDGETERFRREIASRRLPGAYEPGRWSVSPLNRDSAVTGAMPETIRFRDSTLRSIETMPGVVASEDAKAAYLAQLVRAGVAEVVGAGAVGRTADALKREVDTVKSENAECRVSCPLVLSEADIDRVADAGFDGVQVWVQGFGETAQIYKRIYDLAWAGEDWRARMPIQPRGRLLATAQRLVSHARVRGLSVATPMLMVSYLIDDMLEETVAALAGAGATELTLFDGPGAVGPEAYARLVARTLELAPGVEIGLHPHNTFGLAVACAVSAARAGARIIELSVNGYCGGPGNADLAATTAAFEVLYGVRTGIHTEQLTALARAGEKLTGYHVAWNHPITGAKAFNWGGMDIITQEVTVDPLLHNCLEPTLVGNERAVPFTLFSGPYTLIDKLAALGIEADHDQVDAILVAARQRMERSSALLSDEEIAQLAKDIIG
jgi:isopropylmalate/homocitrate/citramalate synthase